jgi:hypothetical protein
VGVEFGRPRSPDTTLAKTVSRMAFERGLMLLTCGTFDNVIRWIAPLVVSEKQIKGALLDKTHSPLYNSRCKTNAYVSNLTTIVLSPRHPLAQAAQRVCR